MHLEQPETIRQQYKPTEPEIACVAEAIRLFRQTVRNDKFVDHRWIVGYAEGVAHAELRDHRPGDVRRTLEVVLGAR